MVIDEHERGLHGCPAQRLINKSKAGLIAIPLRIVVAARSNCFGKQGLHWTGHVEYPGNHIQTRIDL